MAVENVELNAGDNRTQVAFEMAKLLWNNSHDDGPKMTDDSFFELVHECWRCLGSLGHGKHKFE